MGKYIIIPVLVVALITAIFSPPAQAELVAITVVLVAAFGAAVVTSETAKYWDEIETASKDSDLVLQDNVEYALLGM